MKRNNRFHTVWKAVCRYATFFVLVALMTTCVVSLFVGVLSSKLGIQLTSELLNRPAKLTFACVLVLSLLFMGADTLRRRLTTDRITKDIAAATKELVRGRFHTRIAPAVKIGVGENYNEIIDCFNKIARELGSVEMLRADFVADVSHEMKTPLSAVQNYGTLLQASELSEEKRLEYAKGVTDGTRRMADMMTNILKLNRLENQQIYPKREAFDLGEQLCECLLAYETVWEQANIEIETDIEEKVTVVADGELLCLVWNNLFSNAFKFTPAGGTVFVRMTADGHDAVVTVRDTGCGMSAEVGAHIFEKFYQGDTSRATQGNGLGLALVKRVVDILHGDISVESTLGEGSTFTVRLRDVAI